jgi:hypothetical protein
MPLRGVGQERMDEVPEEQEPPSSGDDDEEEQDSAAEGDGNGNDQQLSEENLPVTGVQPRINIPLRAREHSYLPGASHPLFPDSLRERQKVVLHHHNRSRYNRQKRKPPNQQQQQYQQQTSNSAGRLDSTAGVPLGPLSNMNDHDNDDNSSSSSDDYAYCDDNDDKSHLTELAVLELPSVVLFPGSTIPIRLTDRNWTEYLGRQIEASRSLQDSHGHSQTEPVRLGILTRVASPEEDRTTAVRNRRQSWTRQGMGSSRLRRLSEQVVLELGDLVESEDEAQEAQEEANENAQGNDGNDPNDGGLDVTDNTSNSNNHNSIERRRSRPGPAAAAEERRESRRQRRAAVNTGSVRKERHPYIGRIGTIAFVTYTHGDAAMDSNNDDNDNDDNAITVTGGRDEQGSSRVWRSPREQGQLVVTALGTSRFRIDSFAHEEDADIMNRHPEYARTHSMGVKTFLVEELDDEPLSLPPLHHVRHCLEPNAPAAGRYLQYHNRLIQKLSVVSPYPSFVYNLAWPWKMVADILAAVKRVSTFSGLSQSLPCLDDDTGDSDTHRFLEPLTFSFWMACNMPMSEEEKLCLLEMHSTVERLQYIRQKIADEERIESFIHCKSCGIPLSRAAFMFSLSGTEGTTGAYVNEYGCIHQTVTVREVCEAEVWFQGHAETKDSWFEGYSWTIMSCVFCSSHLGWKFQRVDRREDPTPDRPDQFYGLSAASVATQGASTSLNRRSFR